MSSKIDLKEVILDIRNVSALITSRSHSYDFRRRYNPHHSDSVIERENRLFEEIQRDLFFKLKALYTMVRSELAECQVELTEEDKEIHTALEKIIADDLEKELGLT